MYARSRKYLSRAALGFVSASILGLPVMAAEQAIPNLSGVVWGRNFPFFEPPPSGPGPIRGVFDGPIEHSSPLVGDHTNPILKPHAADIVKKRGELSKTGVTPPDPTNLCMWEPTPFTLSSQTGMTMLQHKDGVTILYHEDHKVRHIRMNASHPKNVTPTWQGDSVGHYEGDTLVIDTVGQKVGPYSMVDLLGTPFSPSLHVIERYRLIDGPAAWDAVEKFERIYFPPGVHGPMIGDSGRGLVNPDMTQKGLQLEITVEDPEMFTTPWKAFITYRATLGERFPEVVCAENNTEPGVPQATKADF